MFDKERREQFYTVGELRSLLENWSDSTPVSICGESFGWFHANEDNSGITLDYSDLEESYGDAM